MTETRDRAIPSPAVLAVLCATQFLVVLDAVIVNVALPDIERGLSLDRADLQWVLNAYALAFGGFLLLGGRAGDLFGRRRLFVLGVGLFGLASLAGSFAPSGAALIAARAVQGLGAALVAPNALALITVLHPEGPPRDRALGLFATAATAGLASGALLGGVLTGLFGWSAVLLINGPLAIVIGWAALRQLPQDGAVPARPRGFDLPGAVTVTAGLTLATLAIVDGARLGILAAPTLLAAAGATVLLIAFALIERRTAEPLFALDLLRRPRILGANLLVFVHSAGPLATLFFLSLYLQQMRGLSPAMTGLVFLPFPLAAALGASLAPRWIGRLGPAPVAAAGFGLMMAGLLLFSTVPAVPDGDLARLIAGLCIVGLGTTLSFVPLTIAAVSGVAEREAGLVSGLVNTSLQVGCALVLAVLVAVAGLADDANVLTAEGLARAFRVAALVLAGAALLSLAALRPGVSAAAAPARLAADERGG
ncbi:MAG: MFS transporter [Rhizobiales bacterium]|nr:MFS transporter [Hyphomicrobiales bacterium]